MGADFERIIKASSQSLHDDYELEQEVAKELRAHLEDKCAELQAQGLSEAESVEKAVKCFGDPDEIAPQLFQANVARMKWRGKLKLAVKILILPLLLVALWLSFDYRTLVGMSNLYVVARLSGGMMFPSPLTNRDLIAKFPGRKMMEVYTSKLSGDNLLLFGVGKDDRETIEIRRKYYEQHPDDKLYLMYYVLTARELNRNAVGESLEYAIAHEPGNAYYHYMLAGSYLPPRKIDDKKYEITDWDMARKAIDEYLKGIACPYCDNYMERRFELVRTKLFPKDDFHDRMSRKALAFTITLPQLDAYWAIGQAIPLYAERLIEQGRKDEARKLLDTWPALVLHMLDTDYFFIDLSRAYSMVNDFNQTLPPLYEKLGLKEQADRVAEETARMYAPEAQRREVKKVNYDAMFGNYFNREFHGGWFSQLIGWQWNDIVPITPETMAGDRRLTNGLVDTVVLAGYCLFWFGVIFVLSICQSIGFLRGKRGNMLWLGRKSYLKILVYGVVLPQLLYWSCYNLFHLRELGIGLITLHLIHSSIWAVIFPVWFCLVFRRMLRKRQAEVSMDSKRNVSGMTMLSNLIPALIVFLLISGGIMHFYCRHEISRGLAQDQIFFSGRNGIEDSYVRQHRTQLIQDLRKFNIISEVKYEGEQ